MAILTAGSHTVGIARRICVWLLFPVCLFCAQAIGQHRAAEYQVKAAFLLNFTKFVEWPASAFEDANSPLAICILGDDPFGGALDDLVQGESVNGRKLAVERIRSAPRPKSCQVLYINKAEKGVSAVLSGLGAGVLTVGDGDGFAREGGIIAFVLDGRHVRFDINQRAASDASLAISSRLLNVARTVHK